MHSEPTIRADEEMQASIEAKNAARVLRTLRPEQRQILILSIVQGLSHQEIAEALKMPLGTVKTHARRGLLLAREFLEMNSKKLKGGKA
jgi:RNA polymerase sigma-70 factor (ECF subfamily)